MSDITVSDYQKKTDLVAMENEVLAYWDKIEAFPKSVSMRSEQNRYVFYDGPPFATGLPHYGHILASTIKDVVPRYFTMKGYRVERVWGWDCHGIPIENIVEKELDLKHGKKGIEEYGIGKFNQACRAAIFRFDREWEKVIRRIGRWVDFANSYKTMDTTYMESVWWAFKTLHEKGLVYEGKRVILYCPRCATPLSNFEIAMDDSYKELPGPSTIYKYPVVGEKATFLLAWSTTPWNKLATPALAVNPDLMYVKVKQADEHYILAESTLGMLDSDVPYTVEDKMKGKSLEALAFEPHYSFYPPKKGERTGVIVADPYVTAEEGTGIVTLAVYGEDDYRLMTAHDIQCIEHVDQVGKLKPEVTPWAGMYILKADPLVNEDLARRGLIYRDTVRTHNVPVCYRCETRLYHAPVPAWFIDIKKLKPDLLKCNDQINWYPEHLKYGRFGKGLETAPDWNISRTRYWGTPMPVWVGPSGKKRIIGSIGELKEWAVEGKADGITDIHREYLDDIEVWVDEEKKEKGRRIPEVFDCWVESGSMPYASIHYPFEKAQQFTKSHPAQFIAEYIAQTRAWFYTLHVMSVGLFGTHTFENAVTTGTILAEDGAKMSKSKNNFPDPALLIGKYGADALRFYLMGSVVMKAENLNFSEAGVREVYQKMTNILWNTFSFYKLYAKDADVSVPQDVSHVLDRWLVSRTNGLVRDVTTAMDRYDTVQSCRLIERYVDDLSTWYLRLSRQRIKEDSTAGSVFAWALMTLSKTLAPFMPFLAELLYHNLNGEGSVHWQDWPSAEEKAVDSRLEEDMMTVRRITESLHAIRKAQSLPVKQPLARFSYRIDGADVLSEELLRIVQQELNLKGFTSYDEATWTKDKGSCHGIFAAGETNGEVWLDTVVTQELKREREIRELIRSIQSLRKEQGLAVREPIILTMPEQFKDYAKELIETVQTATLAKEIRWGRDLSVTIG